ncbi:hypothetical protein HOS47_gp26 [Pseudomonas phage uligo]|uniref:Uncharacterized protein n=1 Tax=Pseudomonas phage uligo TaxID=2048979 RepID=A0A2H4P7N1_9CAUD|nr:hypothetical protein HOS47_gp26 [Pseudomonas phage uligo]ATW58185.1 hypothetical protein [Pseudomonas phage uligo]
MNSSTLPPSLRGNSDAAPNSNSVRGKPKLTRIGTEAFDALMCLMAEDPETPTTHHGVFVANSTKRLLVRQIRELLAP